MITLYHNPNVKKAFEILLKHNDLAFDFSQNENDIIITLIYTSAFCEKLVLKNATIDKLTFEDLFSSSFTQVLRNENFYELKGQAFVLNQDKTVDFSLFFESAETNIDIFSALKADMDNSPWNYLQNIADEIITKHYFLGENNLNSTEKQILPLVAGISSLRFSANFPEELKKYNSSQIIPFAEKLGFNNLDKTICKITVKEIKNSIDYSFELFMTLNNVKYEPLYREIYSLFELSQKEYENQNKTEYLKKKIEDYMASLGYCGTYPEFLKMGEIKGPITVQSNLENYTLFNEKNVAFHLRFNESFFADEIILNILSSTEVLKKGNSPHDAIYAMFENKGRNFSIDSNFAFEDINDKTLYKSIDIAVKRAELKKLSQDEKELTVPAQSPFSLFLTNFVLMGGFFGISMAAIFAVINLILDFVWLDDTFDLKFYIIIAAVGWILFGGVMWLISLFSNKRR